MLRSMEPGTNQLACCDRGGWSSQGHPQPIGLLNHTLERRERRGPSRCLIGSDDNRTRPPPLHWKPAAASCSRARITDARIAFRDTIYGIPEISSKILSEMKPIAE